jgi:hypothetical protein
MRKRLMNYNLIALILFGVNFIQCITGHTNEDCICNLHFVLTFNNFSGNDIGITYATSYSGYAVEHSGNITINNNTMLSDTFNYQLPSTHDRRFVLWDFSNSNKLNTKIDFSISRPDCTYNYSLYPYDTTKEYTDYSCDIESYYYDTITIN